MNKFIIKVILTIIICSLFYVLINIACGTIVFVLFERLCSPFKMLIEGIIYLSFVAMMIFIVSRLLREKSVFGKLFENLSYRHLLIGVACGTLCVIVGFLLIYVFKQMNINKIDIRWNFIFSSFVMIAFSAIAEELFFRGFMQNLLTKIIKPIMAVFFTSIIFILFHILNPDLSFLSAFNIFLAGLVFGFSYLITKNLMFTIGFHIFFNCSQSYLGFNISGNQMPSLLELTFPTANIINGGTFGFEGSIVCTVILLGMSLFFARKLKKQS